MTDKAEELATWLEQEGQDWQPDESDLESPTGNMLNEVADFIREQAEELEDLYESTEVAESIAVEKIRAEEKLQAVIKGILADEAERVVAVAAITVSTNEIIAENKALLKVMEAAKELISKQDDNKWRVLRKTIKTYEKGKEE